MDSSSTNEALTSVATLPPIGRSRSPLTCSPRPSTTSEPPSEELQLSRSGSTLVNDQGPPLDDHDNLHNDNDDDSEEIRALTLAAAGVEETDDSSDDTAAECGEGQDDGVRTPSVDYLAPLSSSSASVLGRIAAGFSTAVSGGLHPLKRSLRVAPEPPSPRPPSPKEFFWGPVMPGYPASQPESDATTTGQSTMVIRQTVQMEQTQTSNNSNSDGDIGLRQAIPIMPMYLAVVCCILNTISPGLGTFISGVSLAFCSRPQRNNVDCVSLLLVNVWVAVFQLISSIIFLIGWIWSVIWGFSFITISKEFYESKQGEGESDSREEAGSRQENERATDAGRTSTTTMAMTRTTTTTVSLPEDSTMTASPAVNREPPIIVLQEAPVATRETGLLDAAAAAVWIERQRTLHDPTRSAARTRVRADVRNGNRSAAPMSRRQRLNRRRQQAAGGTAAASGPWNDPLTGVLLCPEALEHIVVHSSILPGANVSPRRAAAGDAQTSK